MKRFFYLLTFLLFVSNLVFSQYSTFNSIITKAQKSEKLENAQWSLTAKYVDSGKKIIDYNSGQNLSPASGLKLITTAAALDVLGPEYKFVTRIYYDGKIDSKGTLQGNLVIRGGSDPALGSDLVKGSLSLDSLMTNILLTLRKTGIKKITGSVFADPNRYSGMTIPRRWIWEDIGNYYGAQTNGLCINDNLYEIYFKPNKTISKKAKFLRTEPEIPNLKFTNFMKTGARGSGDNGYVFCPPNHFTAELRGSIPQGRKEFKIKGSIPNPPLFAAQHLTTFLEKNEISVNGKAAVLKESPDYSSKQILFEYESPELKEIIYVINKKSYNLYTEQILRETGLKVYSDSKTKKGIEAVKDFLKENDISVKDFNIYDGSGLSRSNIISTGMMVDFLISVSGKPYFESFYNSLGIAGKPDDLSSFKSFGRGTLIQNNARIKSGYVAGVRSHSGYVKDKKGRLIAFSFIANNFTGSTSFINKAHKELMIALARLN